MILSRKFTFFHGGLLAARGKRRLTLTLHLFFFKWIIFLVTLLAWAWIAAFRDQLIRTRLVNFTADLVHGGAGDLRIEQGQWFESFWWWSQVVAFSLENLPLSRGLLRHLPMLQLYLCASHSIDQLLLLFRRDYCFLQLLQRILVVVYLPSIKESPLVR